MKGSKISMSKVTELATAQLSATDTLTIELIEADETPAVVIVRWPAKASVFHRDCFRWLPMSLPAPSQPPS
jgi:hypothetical protein